jgi:hypothetical protein
MRRDSVEVGIAKLLAALVKLRVFATSTNNAISLSHCMVYASSLIIPFLQKSFLTKPLNRYF